MLGLPQEAARICQDTYARVKNSDVIGSWASALLAMGADDEAVRIMQGHAAFVPEDSIYTLLELAQIGDVRGRVRRASLPKAVEPTAPATAYLFSDLNWPSAAGARGGRPGRARASGASP